MYYVDVLLPGNSDSIHSGNCGHLLNVATNSLSAHLLNRYINKQFVSASSQPMHRRLYILPPPFSAVQTFNMMPLVRESINFEIVCN